MTAGHSFHIFRAPLPSSFVYFIFLGRTNLKSSNPLFHLFLDFVHFFSVFLTFPDKPFISPIPSFLIHVLYIIQCIFYSSAFGLYAISLHLTNNCIYLIVYLPICLFIYLFICSLPFVSHFPLSLIFHFPPLKFVSRSVKTVLTIFKNKQKASVLFSFISGIFISSQNPRNCAAWNSKQRAGRDEYLDCKCLQASV